MTIFLFLVLCFFTLVVFGCIFLYHWIYVTAQIRVSLVAQTVMEVDKAVDEFFRKAVIVAADEYRTCQLNPDEKKGKIIERAMGIAADVLLQHGLNPKDWHLSGMTRIALFREGLDDLK